MPSGIVGKRPGADEGRKWLAKLYGRITRAESAHAACIRWGWAGPALEKKKRSVVVIDP